MGFVLAHSWRLWYSENEVIRMKYQFHIQLNDQDYLEFNKFVMYRSAYGKKQLARLRILVAVIFLAGMLVTLAMGDTPLYFFFAIVEWAVLLVGFQLCLKPFYNIILKSNIRRMRKTGKMPYSSESTMEFYDDYLVEADGETKTERKYSSVEKVSIIEGQRVYLHINNIMAYIIPYAAFESAEQYGEFMEFLRTKVPAINTYPQK